MIKRPMLAAPCSSADLEKLRYPLLASPKLDGIRLLCHPELGPVTRSFKPLRNRYLRELLSHPTYKGLDGEIMMFDWKTRKPLNFNRIQSAVMTETGQPHIQYWVFDLFLYPDDPYRDRLTQILYNWNDQQDPYDIIRPVEHLAVHSAEEVLQLASQWIEQGFEGLILRDPESPYKSNRSTLREQGMIKYKEFADAEGTIVGYEELYHNQNVQERDAFGLAERSSKKIGMVAAGTLGALVLDTQWGTLHVGTGFDASLRDEIWGNREKYMGATVTFKYQRHGMQDLPRFPVFLRFREAE